MLSDLSGSGSMTLLHVILFLDISFNIVYHYPVAEVCAMLVNSLTFTSNLKIVRRLNLLTLPSSLFQFKALKSCNVKLSIGSSWVLHIGGD